MSTAELINTAINTIPNWKTVNLIQLGIMFDKAKPSDYDQVVTAEADAGDWFDLAASLTRAELIGYKSPTLDEKKKLFLSNVPFFTTAKLPYSSTSGWTNWGHCVLNGYKWSKELNWETQKWDVKSGYDGLRLFRVQQPAVYWWCNIDTGEVQRIAGGRWHSAGMLISIWTHFRILGVAEAASMVHYEWENFNKTFWAVDHYIYAPELPGWEMCFDMMFTENLALAYKAFPLILGDYYFRVIHDIEKRLVNQLWGSPQWGGYKVCIHHFNANPQRRLDPTLGAWLTLHLYYRTLSDTAKRNMRKMLLGEGVAKASDALLQSELYSPSDGRFRVANDSPSTTDFWTAIGASALFFMSIVPNTGALAVPIFSPGTGFAFPYDTLNPNYFKFNYAKRTIIIPVYAGKLGFQFGSKLAEDTFPFDGLYSVTFSQDWNSITGKTRIADLEGLFLQTPRIPTAVESMATSFGTMLAAFPISQFAKFMLKKVKEGR